MYRETLRMALGNVGRAKLRYVLTTCGIMIGTGAIVSMISYAVGMQREISGTISSSGLLTTIYVLPSDNPVARMAQGGADSDGPSPDSARVQITDEVVGRIRSIDAVRDAFPILTFPAMVSKGPANEFAFVAGVPVTARDAMQGRLEAGEMFSTEKDSTLLASASLARKLGVDPDSLGLGLPVTLTIAILGKRSPSSLFSFGPGMSVERKSFRFFLRGVLKEAFVSPLGRMDAYIPLEMTKTLATLTPLSVRDPRDVLKSLSREESEGYQGVEVHVSELTETPEVSEEIRDMGLVAMSVSDQLKQVRTTFAILSAFLGAIGGAALFVGCLGIMNIMLMSVLERTREIGIMKTTGARRRDVLGLFVTEAGFVGVAGGLLGIVLGLIIAEVTNHIMFTFVVKNEIPFKRLYDIPPWLAVGALLLAVAVSIAAGLYPARRAAAMDPAVALRYE
jgi:putative ABC transport system permease protein